MNILIQMIEVCERLANDQQSPADLVDWAVDAYNRLIDPDGMLKSAELQVLSMMLNDYESGINHLSYLLIADPARFMSRQSHAKHTST